MASGFTPPSERSRSNRGDSHSEPELGSRPLVPAAATIMVQRPGTSSSSRAVVRTFTTQRSSNRDAIMPQLPLVMVPVVRLKSFLLPKPRFWRVRPSPMHTMRLGLHCKLRKQRRTANRGKGRLLNKRPCLAARCATKRGKLQMRPVRPCHRHSNLSKPQGLKHRLRCRRCTRLLPQQCHKHSNPSRLLELRRRWL